MTPEQLLATKPKREQFHSDEEFEEATNYWMNRQGMSPMLQPGYKKPPKAAEPPEAEKRNRHGWTRREMLEADNLLREAWGLPLWDLDEPAEGSPSSEKNGAKAKPSDHK